MSEAVIEPGTIDRSAAPTPGTVVPCPLKRGEQIAVGRCVEWQGANGCHCEYALVSLRAVKRLLENDERHQDSAFEEQRHEHIEEVRGLLERVEQIEKQRPAPPAIDPAPAAFGAEVVRCAHEGGCTVALHGDAKVPFCSDHMPLKSQRRTAIAAAVERRREALQSNDEPALPAEEQNPMPKKSRLDAISDDEFRAAFQKHSMKELLPLFKCGNEAIRRRMVALGIENRPWGVRLNKKKGEAPPPSLVRDARGSPSLQERPPSSPPFPDRAVHHDVDLVAVLRSRLAHHEGEAAKCRKALEAFA